MGQGQQISPPKSELFRTKVLISGVPVGAIRRQGNARGAAHRERPRDTSRDREEAYLLRNFLTARFGRDGWTARTFPRRTAKTPVARMFIKQRCKKTIEPARSPILRHAITARRQSQYDPISAGDGRAVESLVRFELTLFR